jgi:hypothetical protein
MDEASSSVLRITRSGGFAGLRRQWQVDVDDHLAEQLQSCRWDDDPDSPSTRDGFQWHIEWTGNGARSVTLSDASLGGWRELLDGVTRPRPPQA